MPGLLDLPAELRLRIYEFVVLEPSPVSIVDFYHVRRPRGIQEATILRDIDISLQDDIILLFWLCNSFCIHLAVDDDSPHTGKDVCLWLENCVGDAALYIRRLEIVVSADCAHPEDGVVMDPRATLSCWTSIHVDLTKPIVVVEEDVACSHKQRVSSRLDEVLRTIPRLNRQPQVSKASVWDLFEACNVLSTRYGGYWAYDQAVRMYQPTI